MWSFTVFADLSYSISVNALGSDRCPWVEDEGELKKRQIAEISSIAIPCRLFFHARTAGSTNRLAALPLSGVEDTIFFASWFETTSYICNEKGVVYCQCFAPYHKKSFSETSLTMKKQNMRISDT